MAEVADDKIRATWKIIKDKRGEHFIVEENPSIKVNNNDINIPHLQQTHSILIS
jgi:hypothetical protein